MLLHRDLTDQGHQGICLSDAILIDPYDKIQEILLDDLPFAPFFSYQTIVGVKDRLKGYEVNPYLTSNAWNTADWVTS